MRRRREKIVALVSKIVDFAQHCTVNPDDPTLHYEAHCYLPEIQLEIEELLTPWPVLLWRAIRRPFIIYHFKDDEIPF